MRNTIVLVILLFFSTVIAVPHTLFAQGKGGRWQFENNGDDTADWDITNNNGTLSGSAFFDNTSPLEEGNYYLSLEDTSQYGFFFVPDDSELDFSNENIGISAWIYPNRVDLNTQFFVIKGDREADPKTNNYALRLQRAYLNFIVSDTTGKAQKVQSSFKIPINQWTFVAAFYNYSEGKVYLWNEPTKNAADTLSFNVKLVPNSDQLLIGAGGHNGGHRFFGRIDDVRIGSKIEDIISIDTGVYQRDVNLTNNFLLNQNYPNPFNAETVISFRIYQTEQVILDIFNLQGQKVSTLVNQILEPGNYKYNFNSYDLPSGIYFYHLHTNRFDKIKKMVLLK